MSHILTDVTPLDLDLPPHFSSFRRIQEEMVDFNLYGQPGIGPKRFMCCGAPPGSGKSLTAHALGIMSGKKYGVLTATRSLEDQQLKDGFIDGDRIVNVRGRSNYECVEMGGMMASAERTCEEGQEWECKYLGKPGCTYFDRVEETKRARGFLTNCQYWMHARSKNKTALEKKGEPVGLLICDEAHKLLSELANFLRAWVSNDELHKYVRKEFGELIRRAHGEEWGRVDGGWVSAIEMLILGIQQEQYKISANYDYNATEAYRRDLEYRKLDKTRADLEKVAEHGRDKNWIWQETKNGIKFNCVWPGKYAERYLWSGVESVVLMSGTLRQKCMHMLNIRSTDYTFKEWPRQFPAHLTPVYWLPTGRMGHKAKQEELDKAVRVGDRIFEEWGHLKGLTHSASYRRAEWLQARCKWGKWMFINERGDATKNAEKFRKAKAPAVLVSPSYTIGIDLPDCIHPDTRILTSDLRYIKASLLHEGDTLAAFDEYRTFGSRGRNWKTSVVTSCSIIKKPCYRLLLEDGTEFTSSENHLWLITAGKHEGHDWVLTKNLKCDTGSRSNIARIAPTWRRSHDWHHGYIAAAFDGEGHLSSLPNAHRSGGNNLVMAFTQKNNKMLSMFRDCLTFSGVSFKQYIKRSDDPKWSDCVTIHLRTRSDIIKVLGLCRPQRLLPKFHVEMLGAIRATPVRLLEKEFIGMQDVVALGTTTKTFVAEGFGSHNSECEWIWIPKLPFPDMSDPVMIARTQDDPDYYNYETMQTLVQSCLRGSRHETDACTVMITDDAVGNFRKYAARHAPNWFKVKEIGHVPKCPSKR